MRRIPAPLAGRTRCASSDQHLPRRRAGSSVGEARLGGLTLLQRRASAQDEARCEVEQEPERPRHQREEQAGNAHRMRQPQALGVSGLPGADEQIKDQVVNPADQRGDWRAEGQAQRRQRAKAAARPTL